MAIFKRSCLIKIKITECIDQKNIRTNYNKISLTQINEYLTAIKISDTTKVRLLFLLSYAITSYCMVFSWSLPRASLKLVGLNLKKWEELFVVTEIEAAFHIMKREWTEP